MVDGPKLLNTFVSQAWSPITSIAIVHILLLASIVKRFPDSELESYPQNTDFEPSLQNSILEMQYLSSIQDFRNQR